MTLGYDLFRSRLLDYYAAKSPASYDKMRYVLDLLDAQGVRSTADLTTAAAARFVAARGPAANADATRGLVSHLKAACSFAVDEGWLDKAPDWRRVTPAAAPPLRRRALDPADVGRLLDALAAGSDGWEGRRLFALTTLVAHAGLRIREALGLDCGDLDLDGPGGAFLTVRPRRGRLKTSASADTAPAPDRAAAVLRAWAGRVGPGWLFPGVKRRGPWTGGEPGRKSVDFLKAAARGVGIPWITWHALRHTFAQAAVREWSAPLWAVQRILRHTSARTTERYLDRGRDDTPRLVGLARGFGYGAA